MYHIFFMRSYICGHLGCFHVLTITNSAAVNIEVHVSTVIFPKVGLLASTGNSTQYSVMTDMEKESKIGWIHVFGLLWWLRL